MSETFNQAITFVLPHETEYVRGHWGDDHFVITENDPSDAGGRTRYGIDARSHPGVEIDSLTRDGAIKIYWLEWVRHQMERLPAKLAIAAFDVWVNGGHASRWLQHAYNATHPAAPQLVEDGAIGPKSLAALHGCCEDAMLREFLAQRDARFRVLAQKSSQRKYLAGWLKRDADLRKFLVGVTPFV